MACRNSERKIGTLCQTGCSVVEVHLTVQCYSKTLQHIAPEDLLLSVNQIKVKPSSITLEPMYDLHSFDSKQIDCICSRYDMVKAKSTHLKQKCQVFILLLDMLFHVSQY